MKLITELTESVEFLLEDNASGGKDVYIKGIFLQSNIVNRNRRIYPAEVMENEVNRYIKESIQANRAYGELNHPPTPSINLDRASHMIKSLVREGDNWIGKAKILDTPCGKIAKELIREGANLGVSSRGVGTLVRETNRDIVQNDFRLATAADIVADPSGPNCFVDGIMENKEWTYVGGLFVERDLAEAKKTINSAVRSRDLDRVKLQVFEQFLNKLAGK